MRKFFLRFTMVVFSGILLSGCSGEEPPKPLFQSGPAVVKNPVIRPIPARPQNDTASIPEKEYQDTASVAPQETEKRGRPDGATRTVQPVQEPESGQPQPEPATGSEASKGSYLVKKGDTLAGVSAKREVYGDRLKWPILYRLNAQLLDSMPAADQLPDLPLQEGLSLRIVTPEEVGGNLANRSGSVWVVNVISATSNAEVVPAVISLIKNDYLVYLSTARVNEKDWMRVRVGFFRTRGQAEAEGKRVMQILSLHDSWVAKLPKSEFSEFAGY